MHDTFDQSLEELVDIGMHIAREIKDRAKDTPPAELAEAFERVSRAVRRTILLAQKRAEAPRARAAARRQLIRNVEDEITTHAKPAEADSLRHEFAERLDAPELDDDIADRPILDIVNEICRDLGLANIPFAPPWPRRNPQDVANIATRANATIGGRISEAPCATPTLIKEPLPATQPRPP